MQGDHFSKKKKKKIRAAAKFGLTFFIPDIMKPNFWRNLHCFEAYICRNLCKVRDEVFSGWLIVAFARQLHAVISAKSRSRKKYFEFNMIQKRNATLLQRFPKHYFAADVDRSKCLHATSANALFCTHYVGNVIYHKFSHGDVSYRFRRINVNVMLECLFLESRHLKKQCVEQK